MSALLQNAESVIIEQCQAVAIPRRISVVMRDIWELSERMIKPRRKAVRAILENRRFRAAYDFLLLRQLNGEVADEQVAWWTDIQEVDDEGKQRMIGQLGGGGGKRPGRRRRKSDRASN